MSYTDGGVQVQAHNHQHHPHAHQQQQHQSTNINAHPATNMQQQHNTHTNHNRQPAPQQRLQRENVIGIPSMTLVDDRIVFGDAYSSSQRSWTQLKLIGDGSFGTVWLCDWHSPLPPGTRLSPMQCGAGARPEWAGKILVALKRMKKPWEGGWDDCKRLKELESLRAIPLHENIISLYDSFLLPTTKELYFVFESMEGNLYQLIRSRKGRALAQGLVFSIFHQSVAGLHHIHSSGYFHRDMKPENLLVTTTGLAEYAPSKAQDVVVIVKIADFGLARETSSRPPYTEYVATRWYRAPEVLLRARDYSNPVDMWALGTIIAELVNLKPLFPGLGEIDQVLRITQILGEPTDRYGLDDRGRVNGGGPWPRGVEMADSYGFSFRKSQPVSFATLFAPTVPRSLVDVIEDLLRYDPAARLKTSDLLDCAYVREMRAQASPMVITPQPQLPPPVRAKGATSLPSLSPRDLPPSHAHSAGPRHPFPATAAAHEMPNGHRSQPHTSSQNDADSEMHDDYAQANVRHPRPPPSPVPSSVYSYGGDRINVNGAKHDWNAMAVDEEHAQQQHAAPHQHKGGLMSGLSFKKPLGRLFGGGDKNANISPTDEQHHPQQFLSVPAAGTKRPQSSGQEYGFSMPTSLSPLPHPPVPHSNSVTQQASSSKKEDPEQKRMRKEIKREQEKAAKADAKAQRALAEAWHREQARAVILKRNQMIRQNVGGTDFDWQASVASHLDASPASKRVGVGTQPQQQQPQVVVTALKEPPPSHHAGPSSQTLDGLRNGGGSHHNPHVSSPQPQSLHHAKSFVSQAGASLFSGQSSFSMGIGLGGADLSSHQHPLPPHPGMPTTVHRYSDDSSAFRTKARRRELDDDHSNSDVQSISHISMISFATVDSDPGPTSGSGRRHRDRDYHHSDRHAPYPPTSGRRARDLERAASVASFRTTTDHSQTSSFEYGGGGGGSNYGGSDYGGAPGPRGRLSTATSSFTGGSPSPVLRPTGPPLSPPPMHALSLSNGQWRAGSEASDSSPSSPAALRSGSYIGMSMSQGGSTINPMFQVPSPPREGSLPPFSHLASVADGQQQPISPLQHPHANSPPPD